jgi:arylsulfatase A-like enzyme
MALDDMNTMLGCYGHPDARTPHIDRLAQQGMVFTNACCQAPICNPSRTSLLTGLRPSTTGCYCLSDNLVDSPQNGKTLPLPLYFRKNGYKTMAAGKIDHGGAEGPVEAATREAFGESMWDEFGGAFGGQQYGLRSRHASCLTETDSIVNWSMHWGPLDEDQAETLSDTHVAQWVCERIGQDHDKPFFIGAGFHRPHLPLVAPKRFFDLHDKAKLSLPPTGPEDMAGMPELARQIALAQSHDLAQGTHYQVITHDCRRDFLQAYHACASYADDCIGQVLDALERSPHANNTIVVLWGDNGWSLGEHFHWQKWSLWDSGARVPFIIRLPESPLPGTVCAEGVGLIDIYPTLVELCGLPPVAELEGLSLSKLLCGEETTRAQPTLTTYSPGNHSLRSARHRYTRYADGTQELYDYAGDPHEHHNAADDPAYAQVKEAFRQYLPATEHPALRSSPVPGKTIELAVGQSVQFHGMQPGFAGRRVTVRAGVRRESDIGIVVHHMSWFSGYALYLLEGKLCMAVTQLPLPLRWDRLQYSRTIVRSDEALPRTVTEVEGSWHTDGRITLKADGKLIGSGKANGPLSIYPVGLLEAGRFLPKTNPDTVPGSKGRQALAIGDHGHVDLFQGELSDITVAFEEE